LTNRSTKPYPWPPKQAQPDVSKPGRSTHPAHADLQVRQSAQIRRGGRCDITTHSRLQRAFNEYFSHDLEFSAGILTDFLGRVSTAGTVLAID